MYVQLLEVIRARSVLSSLISLLSLLILNALSPFTNVPVWAALDDRDCQLKVVFPAENGSTYQRSYEVPGAGRIPPSYISIKISTNCGQQYQKPVISEICIQIFNFVRGFATSDDCVFLPENEPRDADGSMEFSVSAYGILKGENLINIYRRLPAVVEDHGGLSTPASIRNGSDDYVILATRTFNFMKTYYFRKAFDVAHYIDRPSLYTTTDTADSTTTKNPNPSHGRRLAFTATVGKASGFPSSGYDGFIRVLDFLPWHIEVGPFSVFAGGVEMLLSQKGGTHRYDFVSNYGFDFAMSLGDPEEFVFDPTKHYAGDRNLTIGADVWVGWGAKIINNVTIGHGAVLGAYAVVRENVPPYAIVTGNPAKIVKYRFSEEHRLALLSIKWWEWGDDEIMFRMPRESDVDALIAYNRSRQVEVVIDPVETMAHRNHEQN